MKAETACLSIFPAVYTREGDSKAICQSLLSKAATGSELLDAFRVIVAWAVTYVIICNHFQLLANSYNMCYMRCQ